MKVGLVIGTLALAVAALPGIAMTQAQDNAPPDAFSHTVTGCLKKSTNPNVFSLTDENGKMWELRSKHVRLGQHVNHKVSVTGKLPQKTKGGDASSDVPAENRLRVTSLKMVSDSCTAP